jgi:hypothetical protein
VNLFIHFPGARFPADAKRDWHLVFDGSTWRLVSDYPPTR